MSFECIENCGQCCGMHFISKSVFEKHKDSIRVSIKKVIDVEEDNSLIVVMTEDLFCVFLDRETKLCAIYEDRPKVCREYGLTDRLPCPFLKKNGNKRSLAKTKRVQRQVSHQIDDVMKRYK